MPFWLRLSNGFFKLTRCHMLCRSVDVRGRCGVLQDRLARPTWCDDFDGFVVADFDSTSMSNIDSDQSHLLWAHLICIYIISIIVLRVRPPPTTGWL